MGFSRYLCPSNSKDGDEFFGHDGLALNMCWTLLDPDELGFRKTVLYLFAERDSQCHVTQVLT